MTDLLKPLGVFTAVLVVATALVVAPATTPAAAQPAIVSYTCETSGPVEATGAAQLLTLLGDEFDTLIEAIESAQLPLPLVIDLAATPSIDPGGTITYQLGFAFDLGTIVGDLFDTVIEPVLSLTEIGSLLEDTYLSGTVEDLSLSFPHPAQTAPDDSPVVSASGTTATGAHDSGAFVLVVTPIAFDSRTPSAPVQVDATWTMTDVSLTPPTSIDQPSGPVELVLAVAYGGNLPLTPLPISLPVSIGLRAPWRCTPSEDAATLATTDVSAPEVLCSTPFVDVQPSDPFCDAIAWAVNAGIVDGYADGTFGPTQVLTRQAMAAFMHRASGSPPTAPSSSFSDVTAAHQFADPIGWLAGAGFTTGYEDGTFGPARPLTRQAFAAITHRWSGSPAPPVDAPAFSDVAPTHPFASAIGWLTGSGYAEGTTETTFGANQPTNRGDAIMMLHQIVETAEAG